MVKKRFMDDDNSIPIAVDYILLHAVYVNSNINLWDLNRDSIYEGGNVWQIGLRHGNPNEIGPDVRAIHPQEHGAVETPLRPVFPLRDVNDDCFTTARQGRRIPLLLEQLTTNHYHVLAVRWGVALRSLKSIRSLVTSVGNRRFSSAKYSC